MRLDLSTLAVVPSDWTWLWHKREFLEAPGSYAKADCSACSTTGESVYLPDDGEPLLAYPHCPKCHQRHRVCGECGECLTDWTTNGSKLFCSPRCRQRTYRKRKNERTGN